MGRRLLRAGALALLALFGLAVLLLALYAMERRPGVTRANYQRIQNGMRLAEVEALLGRPADETVSVSLEAPGGPVPPGRAWEDNGLRVTVWPDRAGAVSDKDIQVVGQESLAERLRGLLPW
jgi:hypothetical protein